ncbi:unnamed protein product, partial [Laminaria digitata]
VNGGAGGGSGGGFIGEGTRSRASCGRGRLAGDASSAATKESERLLDRGAENLDGGVSGGGTGGGGGKTRSKRVSLSALPTSTSRSFIRTAGPLPYEVGDVGVGAGGGAGDHDVSVDVTAPRAFASLTKKRRAEDALGVSPPGNGTGAAAGSSRGTRSGTGSVVRSVTVSLTGPGSALVEAPPSNGSLRRTSGSDGVGSARTRAEGHGRAASPVKAIGAAFPSDERLVAAFGASGRRDANGVAASRSTSIGTFRRPP